MDSKKGKKNQATSLVVIHSDLKHQLLYPWIMLLLLWKMGMFCVSYLFLLKGYIFPPLGSSLSDFSGAVISKRLFCSVCLSLPTSALTDPFLSSDPYSPTLHILEIVCTLCLCSLYLDTSDSLAAFLQVWFVFFFLTWELVFIFFNGSSKVWLHYFLVLVFS